MLEKVVCALLAGAAGLATVPVGAAVVTQEIAPNWVDEAPVVDGRLDEMAWKLASEHSAFRTTAGLAKAATSVRLLYDGEAFYVGFDAAASETAMQVVYTEDGQPVWQDESVEVFVAPWGAPDAASLYHFVVNAAGAKTFLRMEETRHLDGWDAAVSRTSTGWQAELYIPLSVFEQQGQNEANWRILFGRNSSQYQESSSFPPSERFAWFWNYARLVAPEGKPTFLRTRGQVEPLEGSGPTGVQPLKQVPAEAPGKPLIIPEPVHARFTGGRFALNANTTIVIGQQATSDDRRAAEVLAEWISTRTGIEARLTRSLGAPANLRNVILLGEPDLNPLAADALKGGRQRVTADDPGPEGYRILVNKDLAVASGSDRDGTFWAAQTLAQMMETDGKSWWIATGSVMDRPAMPFRSAHLLTAKDALEFQSKLIRNILSPFKINHVILQMDKYAWESHPEIVDESNNISSADLRKLIEVGRQYNITYIPLVMSLGHMEWIFRGGHHLDIAEDPNHPYAYCPLNEKSYELMYDLFDEAYELFGRPEIFHIGHDEFDMIGEFPTHEECRKLGKVELYYRDTQKVVQYLRQKGARSMMWGDILSKVGFLERLDELPRDIIIADWRYSPNEEFPSVNLFRDHGFEVVACTWYDPRNIFYFSNYANQNGAQGMMQTTWTGWHTEDVVLQQWPEQMFQYAMGAEWAWSPGRPTLSAMSYRPDQVFLQRWGLSSLSSLEVQPAEGEMFTVALGSYANASTRDASSSIGWIGTGADDDLSALRAGNRRLGKVSYHVLSPSRGPNALMLQGPPVTSALPDGIRGIEVGSEARQLWFLHTTAFPDRVDGAVGRYVIHYADGSSTEIALNYGQNIMSWKDDRPTLAYQAAWEGQTRGGTGVRLRAFPWENPYPEKVIRSIDFEGAPSSQAAPVLLAITGIR